MDIQIATLLETDNANLFPTRDSDSYGYHWPFALTYEAVFQVTIPDTYVAGNALGLKVYERSDGNLEHKWEFSVQLSGETPVTVTQECQINLADLQTIQSITLSADGTIDSVAVQAGDLLEVTMKRIAADDHEDDNDIRVYALVLTTELDPSAGCLGRVGQMVDSVLVMVNEITHQDFLKASQVIRWFNRCTKLLAADLIWSKVTTITWPSGAPESVDLLSAIPDLVQVHAGGVRLTSTNVPVRMYGNLLEFGAAKRMNCENFACIAGNSLYVYTVPAEGVQYDVYHAYCPEDVGCAANTTPPVDLSHDLVYEDYAIAQGCLMDRTNKNAQAQATYYLQSFEQRRRSLGFQMASQAKSFRPSR